MIVPSLFEMRSASPQEPSASKMPARKPFRHATIGAITASATMSLNRFDVARGPVH